MLTDIWGYLLAFPADTWNLLVALWNWYVFPALEAFGVGRRTENSPGNQAVGVSEADQDIPPGPETPQVVDLCTARALIGWETAGCLLELGHDGLWHYDLTRAWRRTLSGTEVRKATGPAPVQSDAPSR